MQAQRIRAVLAVGNTNTLASSTQSRPGVTSRHDRRPKTTTAAATARILRELVNRRVFTLGAPTGSSATHTVGQPRRIL